MYRTTTLDASSGPSLVRGSGYTVSVATGRSDCATVLSADSCSTGIGVGFVGTSSQSGLQLWDVRPAPSTAPPSQVLPDGNYYIASTTRDTCPSYLSGGTCNGTAAVTTAAASSGGGQVWSLTYRPDAVQPNTYNIVNGGRAACASYLSAPQCPNNFVDMFFVVSRDLQATIKLSY